MVQGIPYTILPHSSPPTPPNGFVDPGLPGRLALLAAALRSSFTLHHHKRRWLLLGTFFIAFTLLFASRYGRDWLLGDRRVAWSEEAGPALGGAKDPGSEYEAWLASLSGGIGLDEEEATATRTGAEDGRAEGNGAVSVNHRTTELGLEADQVYNLGFEDLKEYQDSLETFIKRHFPKADSDETDPDSLLNTMRRFFRPSNSRLLSPIPFKLFQTAPDQATYDERGHSSRESFEQLNQGLNITFHDNERADQWVRRRFQLELDDDGSNGKRGIVAAWEALSNPPVLRSDFWRYLVLATEGGYYGDTDVLCLKPTSAWELNPDWNGKKPNDFVPPSLIVGIEADVGERADWHQWWPRPIQISQWTMGASRGHPVLIDSVRRVVEKSLNLPGLAPSAPTKDSTEPIKAHYSVMELTGPGVFTDAALAYTKLKWSKSWGTLRGLGPGGWRYKGRQKGSWGDMLLLSITGFSPGIGHMNAGTAEDNAAMAAHLFSGSWKEQEGASG